MHAEYTMRYFNNGELYNTTVGDKEAILQQFGVYIDGLADYSEHELDIKILTNYRLERNL